MTTAAKPKTPDLDTYLEEKSVFAGHGSVSHSPPRSEIRSGCDRTFSEAAVDDQDSVFGDESSSYLIDIKNERIALEDFLFNESNKICKIKKMKS